MTADPLSVRLLGHVSAHRGGRRVEVTGAQRLAMLSMLALRAGECVSSVQLIYGIWGEEAPDQARHALHVYISELRAALGADAIETRRGGYRLCVEEEQVDALLFEQLVGRVNGGPPAQTSRNCSTHSPSGVGRRSTVQLTRRCCARPRRVSRRSASRRSSVDLPPSSSWATTTRSSASSPRWSPCCLC